MKVLILTVTAGFGHHATAAAVSDALKSREIETETVDIYKYINRLLYGTIDKGYLFSSKYTPGVYRTFYNMFEKKKFPEELSPATFINLLCGLKFEKFIDDFKPDVIVCTHVFAAQIINELKARKKVSVPVMGIVTDYTIHPGWDEIPDIDYIITASNLLTYSAVQRGISVSRIAPLGIPIKPGFSDSVSKADARKLLDVPSDKKVVLLMGGSMGYGSMSDIFEKICGFNSSVFTIAVCGRNEKQFKKLVSLNSGYEKTSRASVYGFTDKVSLMMDAADCIVTKPGGLTVSEALCKRLPLILVNPIPGQEERNREFLVNNGAAIMTGEFFPVDNALNFLFCDDGEHIKQMLMGIDRIRRPNAAQNIAEFIIWSVSRQKADASLFGCTNYLD